MQNFYSKFLMIITIILALLLDDLFYSIWDNWFFFSIVSLVTLFWLIESPYVGFKSVFFIGLYLDLIQGTILGENALILIVMSSLAIHFKREDFSFFKMILSILLLFFLKQITVLILQIVQSEKSAINYLFFILPFINTILYLLISITLKPIIKKISNTQ